jgi:predicted dehydrogenase
VTADFGFRAEFDPQSRLFSPELGGGTLLDIGIYPLNLALMICGEPVEIQTMANLGATGVDEECALLLRHGGGRISVLTASFLTDTPRQARILGTEGSITLCFPWWAATRIVLKDAAGREAVQDLPSRGGGYTHEAEAFMELIRTDTPESAILPLADSLAVLRIMDEIRSRWGLRYPTE